MPWAKPSLMCWAMSTGAGRPAGSAGSSRARAWGPPVETAMAITAPPAPLAPALGVITGAATYGITSTAVSAAASWAAFRSAVVRFMAGNAATGPGDVKALIRPEVWAYLDGLMVGDGGFKFEFDRLKENLGEIVMSTNALAAPAGEPLASSALLATTAGGVSPIFVGLWGAVDLIRDPFSDAQSGGLRLTALTTADVTVARASQLELLTGVQAA